MARALEEERSEERIAAVDESIGVYLSTITGESEHGRVRVEAKRTATRVSYRLLDERDRVITTLLNHVAFNALSLAVLTNGPLEDWIVARYTPGELPSGKALTGFRFRAYRDRDLERRIRTAFDHVVDRDLHTAITRRQRGLDEVLQRYPAWRRA